MPNSGNPAEEQFPLGSGLAKSELLEIAFQRFKQAIPGSTGVGEGMMVSVGVGGISVAVPVGGTSVGVIVGGAVVGGIVSVNAGAGGAAGSAVGSDLVNNGKTPIKAATIVPIMPINAIITVGLENILCEFLSELVFLLIIIS